MFTAAYADDVNVVAENYLQMVAMVRGVPKAGLNANPLKVCNWAGGYSVSREPTGPKAGAPPARQSLLPLPPAWGPDL